jgi:hypothetical protein
MRHASSRCTLEVYSQAQIKAKRLAQQRLVQMILSEEADKLAPLISVQRTGRNAVKTTSGVWGRVGQGGSVDTRT